MANALWWVRGRDKKTDQTVFMSLSSPDLLDTRKAKNRAKDTAKQRWKKKGIAAVVLSVECVG